MRRSIDVSNHSKDVFHESMCPQDALLAVWNLLLYDSKACVVSEVSASISYH